MKSSVVQSLGASRTELAMRTRLESRHPAPAAGTPDEVLVARGKNLDGAGLVGSRFNDFDVGDIQEFGKFNPML